MSDHAVDHYETLGVDRGASPTVVKTAYLRLIQVHTPEKSPEQFRLISDAYRTLSNPERRKEYDAAERLPPKLQQLIHTIMTEAEHDPGSAAEELLTLGKKHSQFPSIRRLAAILFHRHEEYGVAAEIFQDLFALDVTNSDLAAWLGASLLEDGRKADGVAALKEALVLDAGNTNAYVALAHHHVEEEEDGRALDLLERGIQADGKVDVADLPLFIAMFVPLARLDLLPRLHAHASRLAALVPESDADARRYVASQLMPILLGFDSIGRPDLTMLILDLMLRLDPHNEALRSQAQEVRPAATLWSERSELFANKNSPDWILALVAALTTEEGKDAGGNVVANITKMAVEHLDRMSGEWQRFRSSSPHLAAELQQAWAFIDSNAKEARRRFGPRQAAAAATGTGPSGCLIFLMTIPPLLTAVAIAIGALL